MNWYSIPRAIVKRKHLSFLTSLGVGGTAVLILVWLRHGWWASI